MKKNECAPQLLRLHVQKFHRHIRRVELIALYREITVRYDVVGATAANVANTNLAILSSTCSPFDFASERDCIFHASQRI